MNQAQELSKRIVAWHQAHKTLLEWTERHSIVSEDEHVDQEELADLRRRLYQCEWRLLSLGARRDHWENALPVWLTDDEKAELRDLRLSAVDMDFSSSAGSSDSGSRANTVSGWWFMPYALWVGEHGSSQAFNGKELAFALEHAFAGFKKHIQEKLPEVFEISLKDVNGFLGGQVTFYHFLDADKVRGFSFPAMPIPKWSKEDQSGVAFHANNSSSYRKGCVAMFFQGADYQSMAMMRDAAREFIMDQLEDEDINSETIQFGPLLSCSMATEEAELLHWDLWTDSVLENDLTPQAEGRHVVLQVLQKEGVPVLVKAQFADIKGEENLRVGAFECQLFEPSMLLDVVDPFIKCGRHDVAWTMERREISPT